MGVGEIIQISNSLQLVCTVFAALLGLAFGSFLNVVISRLPEGESIVTPRSHCRNCDHTLAWWENLPVLSWLLLLGRCRQCQIRISLRYPFIELTIAILWAAIWLNTQSGGTMHIGLSDQPVVRPILLIGFGLLSWLLIALAALDAEYLWLPDWITLPGIVLGFIFSMMLQWFRELPGGIDYDRSLLVRSSVPELAVTYAIAILACAGLILIIRLAYWLVRRQEGMGLGDAKLMAMLGAWLGLQGALESFALAIFGALIAALVWLAILSLRRKSSEWAKMPLPLGTFLCLGALTEIFYPNWLWTTWTHAILNN